jgi:hypothetical protein
VAATYYRDLQDASLWLRKHRAIRAHGGLSRGLAKQVYDINEQKKNILAWTMRGGKRLDAAS